MNDTNRKWCAFYNICVGSPLLVLLLVAKVIDSATYVASACLLWMVRGDYNVASSEKEYQTFYSQVKGMTVDGVKYLKSSFFGALVFMKASAALAYGAADVLTVALSEQPLPGDPIKDRSQRLGILFAFMGVGCVLGPLLGEPLVDLQKPSSVQMSCVVSLCFVAVGYFGWGLFSPFSLLCFFVVIRSSGSSVLWINSSLLLQKFSDSQLLGRVMAIDYALALLTEAASAYTCGVLVDRVGFSASDVSLVMAIIAAFFTVVWGSYHYCGHGAVNYRDDDDTNNSADEAVALVPGVELEYIHEV